MNTQKYFDRLRKAQYQILMKYPFYGKLLLSLPFGLHPNCVSAYTDMKRIVFDPRYIDELDDRELEIVILHELLHCVLFHCTRAAGKIQLIYNLACDIVVNSIIYQDYHVNHIASYPFMHTYQGKEGYHYSADELYELMLNNKEEDITGGLDRHDPWLVMCKDPQLEKKMNEKIQTTYKTAGNLAGGVVRKLLEERYRPKINWKNELYEYLSYEVVNEDYTFNQRDTRFIDGDYVIPSLIDDEDLKELNQVILAIDVSGSIDEKEFQSFYHEIQYAFELLHIHGHYTFFDTKLSPFEKIDTREDLNVELARGYGGTNFQVVFDRVLELNQTQPIKALIMFTDGYAPFPPEIEIPVIWVITNNQINPPYGKVIRLINQ